jgi:hypothetical protein
MLCLHQVKLASTFLSLSPNYHQFVEQHPSFVRILQASWLLRSYPSWIQDGSFDLGSFRQARLLLDLSWDEITEALYALQRILGGRPRAQIFTGMITVLAHSLEIYPDALSSLTGDLAAGYLHLVWQIGVGRLPQHVWQVLYINLYLEPNSFPIFPGLIRDARDIPGANSSGVLRTQTPIFWLRFTDLFHPGVHSPPKIV